MRSKTLLAIAVAALFLAVSSPANAQLVGTDTVPGSSCAGFPTGATQMTADANNDRRQVVLICNGTIWEREQFAGETIIGTGVQSCAAALEGAIRYDTTLDCIELCNGVLWQCIVADACPNSLPAAFTFTNQTNVAVSTLATSNIVQITGITGCTVQVKVSGQGTPEYQTCSDAACATFIQDWTSSPGTIQDNQYLRLRLTSSSSGNITFTAAVTVGARVGGWFVATTGDCTDPSPPVGTFCADGTVYVGLSPDGGTKMYVRPCRMGKTWNGTVCTGSTTPYQFSQGPTINTGVTGVTTGASNTAALAGLSNADSPYSAASICDGLSFGGHSDWYLPSINEAGVLQSGCDLIPEVICSSPVYQWSSRENAITTASRWAGDGSSSTFSKSTSYGIFCTRKD